MSLNIDASCFLFHLFAPVFLLFVFFPFLNRRFTCTDTGVLLGTWRTACVGGGVQERQRKVTQRQGFSFKKKQTWKQSHIFSKGARSHGSLSKFISVVPTNKSINHHQSSVIAMRVKVKSVLRSVGENQLLFFFSLIHCVTLCTCFIPPTLFSSFSGSEEWKLFSNIYQKKDPLSWWCSLCCECG